MKIDRISFLAFATSLAAVACGASPAEESDTDEGALQCVQAGEDRTPDSTLNFCTKFAADAAAVGEHEPSVKGVCEGYITNFKSDAAKRAKTCMEGLRISLAGRGPSFDWMGLYECGYSSLRGTCTAEGTLERCRDILKEPSQMITSQQMADFGMVEAECTQFMSGLSRAGADNVAACVQRHKFPVYSCVEGIDPNAQAKTCLDSRRPAESMTRLQIAEQCTTLRIAEDARPVCLQLVKATRVAMAERLVSAIQMATVDRTTALSASVVHNIGLRTLREACRAPEEVDGLCKKVVEKYEAAGKSNAGGRITRECRTVFPGLLKSARDRVLNGSVAPDGRITTALVQLVTPAAATPAEFPEAAE